MLLSVALLGVAMLTCTLCSVPRRAAQPTAGCLNHYKEVIVLLQGGQKLEARARAMLIRCEHVRIQALTLIERSRPFTPPAAGWDCDLPDCDLGAVLRLPDATSLATDHGRGDTSA